MQNAEVTLINSYVNDIVEELFQNYHRQSPSSVECVEYLTTNENANVSLYIATRQWRQNNIIKMNKKASATYWNCCTAHVSTD